MQPVDHLFRRESGRIVATLTRAFGIGRLALAEDVVQEAFCRALEVWPFRGVPENPSAWLMTTAKHCALDALRRERTARSVEPELSNVLQSEFTAAQALDELFASSEIKDDLLRMMFSCCHPRLPQTAQAAVILHILCGFSIDEVASAFVSGRAAMEKRITRAKKLLAKSRRGCRRCSAPCICCSTRVTTAPRRKPPCTRNSAARPVAWRRSCSRTRSGRYPPRTPWLR
jgi:RNA polymerase sigma-70 factor (ECF subfamily)